MMQALIVAYGNPLRGDDGLAWAIADILRPAVPDSVQFLRVHQLSPELADHVNQAEVVIFLDATADGAEGDIHCRPLVAQTSKIRFWHHIRPEEILTLCKQLYAASPQAFLVTVRGERFDYEFALSDAAKNAIPRSVATLSRLLEHYGIPCANAAQMTT